MTIAETAHARFEELQRTYPADLSKHLKDIERLAVKRRIVEDRPPTRAAPGLRVLELEFDDGSKLRVELTKRYRETYRWTSCRVL